ncbi:hypothetical protein GON26_01365 [Flavobacterium sp. GA093]|uniref:Phage tail protein n=1 Tax=Flavobacterium hydrocarbonoxydans TaxID=2683249 RepID=A0A6I4NFI2_9FLAO|nr:hypothetical protein [Flavobacterium hydrocarbonoxydans]MWB92998.1 hypothetical protein [Flavobacterium hydrocarbonoxydans]
MNKSNFNQTGGYPLKTERLQELQTSFEIFNAFGSLAGNLAIVSGCEIVGSTVKNGFLYIDGELLEFRESALAIDSTVVIFEEPVKRFFENDPLREVYTIRYTSFGTAEESWLWTDFKRPIETKSIPTDLISRLTLIEKKLAIFQSGGVVFPWFKPVGEIPEGFQEVADMKGRMIIGYDPTQTEFNLIGKNGGLKNKTLSISEMPSHDHTFSGSNSNSSGTSNHVITTGQADEGSGKFGMQPTGGGQAFSLLNPYRVAAYIEFIG